MENIPSNYKYYNNKHKKFNEEEFQKQIKNFYDWEKRKNEKIKKKQLEKEKKELKDYNKKNIHHNKHLSNKAQSNVVERLYTDDIRKRKEKKETLLKIYEFSFQPNICSHNLNNTNNNGLSNTKSSMHFNRNNINKNINNYKSNNIQPKSKNKKHSNREDIHAYMSTSINKRKKEESSDEDDSESEDRNDEEVIANKLRSKLFSVKKK